MTEKEQHMIFQSDTCMVNDNMICWIKERKHRRRHFMGKAENGEIREVTANIWEDRKHHLWFPLSFTKYTVGNGRLYVNSGFLSSREDECLLYRITDITLYRSLPQRIFGTGTIELHTKDRSTPVIREGTEKHTIFILTLIKKEKNHQSFYDSGGFFVRRNINCLFFRRKFLFFIH